MMIAVKDGKVKAVIRQRRGVVWCPYCDRSRMVSTGLICDGCGAEFSETVETPVEATTEPETITETTEDAETPSESPPRRRREGSA